MAQPKDFGFGEDEKMVRDSARKFIGEHGSIEKLRKLVGGDPDPEKSPESLYDAPAWEQIVELGWTALAIPEEAGGVGMNMATVAALAEVVGGHAFPSPLIASLLTTLVVREASGENRNELLGEIAEGKRVALAVTGNEGAWDIDSATIEVAASGGSVVLSGFSRYVQDGGKAELFLVAGRSAAGLGLYAVPADAKGLKVTLDQIVDRTRDQATLELDGVELPASAVIAAPADGTQVLEKALPALLTVVAADMVGASEWQLQTTTEYAKTREQFNHPLGFFQAVKHPIVNMMLEIDKAKSLVYAAASAIDNKPENAERFARMAKAQASDTAAFCSDRSVQLHGGIGFTWECDVHFFFKRNKHNQFLFGDGAYQRSKLMKILAG
ncbi:MAG: acyl-CoA dehydrogenase family protein [Polyangiaceae bacterium]|nr:acyl-CoA dehydrogenase family protein [Polyangiaceae bacterium]